MERPVIEQIIRGEKNTSVVVVRAGRKTSRSQGKEIAAYERERGGILGLAWNFMSCLL